MDICFEGIGQMVATFATDEELIPGMAVALKKSGTVGLDGEGKTLCGVTVGAARNGAVAVQIGGVVKVGCSDSTELTVGYAALDCDGDGKVTKSAEGNGVKCLVLAVDEDGDKKSVVIKL